MLTKQEIYDRYKSRSVSGYEFYFRIPLALEFIDECNKNDLLVIGVEGFIHKDGKLESQLDLIEDYSHIYTSKRDWSTRKNICYEKAVKFLVQLLDKPDAVVNFVVFSNDERKSAST
jgi:hypothetical protein